MQGTGSGTPKQVFVVQGVEYDGPGAALDAFSLIMGETIQESDTTWYEITTFDDAVANRQVYIGWVDRTLTPDDTQEVDVVPSARN